MGGEVGTLQVNWQGLGEGVDVAGDRGTGGQVLVTLHMPGAMAVDKVALGEANSAERAERVRRIVAGGPLPDAAAPDEQVSRMIARVTGEYAYADLAREPAVRTVTALKALGDDAEEGVMDAPAAEGLEEVIETRVEGKGDPLAAEKARARGIATHRVLELLDFAHCDSEAAIAEQVRKMVVGKKMSAEEAGNADMPGIAWFVEKSSAGRRLIAAAKSVAGGSRAVRVRRELPFTWAAPLPGKQASTDPADWPTIRGVIDVLIVDTQSRTAEIIDYKTDSAFLWESRLAEYQRQMRYYLRAASEILGFKVEKATLVFLSPRIEQVAIG